ncbi:MAG: photosynthetic complex putative assembly protein PuhB [Rubrimonas sp.]
MSEDFAFEPRNGLPGLLPRGERILWQGRPNWLALARGPLLGDWVAIYFGALVAWRVADGMAAGAPGSMVLAHSVALGLMGAICLVLIGLIGWAMARTTTYTITNRRVVLKIGVALRKCVNVPFKRVAAATLRATGGGRGDIILTVGGKDRFAWLMLWPHVRPWRLGRPEPMLRGLPDAAAAASVLGRALALYQAENGVDAPIPAGPPPHPDAVLTPAE